VISKLSEVQQQLQDDMDMVVEWTTENRMVLNASKTIQALLVAGKRLEKKLRDTKLIITVSGKEIEQVTSQKLLGLKLDKNLYR
jgi:hypothetical protein